MYRWKFSENSSFSDNQSYVNTLIEVIPEDSTLKEFISYESKYASLLSFSNHHVRYPLSIYTAYPRMEELEGII